MKAPTKRPWRLEQRPGIVDGGVVGEVADHQVAPAPGPQDRVFEVCPPLLGFNRFRIGGDVQSAVAVDVVKLANVAVGLGRYPADQVAAIDEAADALPGQGLAEVPVADPGRAVGEKAGTRLPAGRQGGERSTQAVPGEQDRAGASQLRLDFGLDALEGTGETHVHIAPRRPGFRQKEGIVDDVGGIVRFGTAKGQDGGGAIPGHQGLAAAPVEGAKLGIADSGQHTADDAFVPAIGQTRHFGAQRRFVVRPAVGEKIPGGAGIEKGFPRGVVIQFSLPFIGAMALSQKVRRNPWKTNDKGS